MWLFIHKNIPGLVLKEESSLIFNSSVVFGQRLSNLICIVCFEKRIHAKHVIGHCTNKLWSDVINIPFLVI